MMSDPDEINTFIFVKHISSRTPFLVHLRLKLITIKKLHNYISSQLLDYETSNLTY